MKLMQVLLRRNATNIIFIVALFILAGSNFYAYKQTLQRLNSYQWVLHTQQVINKTNQLLVSLSNSRYLAIQALVANNSHYLHQLRTENRTSLRQLTELRNLTTDNPKEQKNIYLLEPLVKERIQFLEKFTTVNNPKLALEHLIKGDELSLTSRSFKVINDMLETEVQLLNHRLTEEGFESSSSTFIFILSTVISEILLLFCIILLNHHLNLRIRAEQAKTVSEARLHLLINSAKDYAIIMLDPKGFITSWNTGAERITGYTTNEIIGKHFSCFYTTQAQQARHPEHELKIAKNLGRYEEEGIRLRKDGVAFWSNVVISPMWGDNGTLVGFSKVTRDLTERKKIESVKNEFISVVSHELRTPLTSIRGSLSLILGGVGSKSPEKVQHLLEIASANCDRLVRLINDILDIEKIDAGKMDFSLQPYQLKKIMDTAISVNQIYAEKFRIKLVAKHIPDDILINVDSDRMMQVLTNLISNGVKFSKLKGVVTLSAVTQDSLVRIAVTNQGKGIPDTFKNKIFQKFSQVDVRTNRQEAGTGLGLAISKAIIEKFGGRLHFTSEVNKKTVFYIDLPLFQSKFETDGLLHDVALPLKKSDPVLICEDDEEQAIYLSTLLHGAGYQTYMVSSAAETKEQLKKRSYYALLLDLILPDKNGIELIKELRQMPTAKHLPIIVISIMAKEGESILKDNLVNGNAIEIVDWLEKPIDFNKLSNAFAAIKEFKKLIKPKILHIEDDKDSQIIVQELLAESAEVIAKKTIKACKKILSTEKFELVILDLVLPDGNGIELLPLIAEKGIPVIVFASGALDPQYAHYVTNVLSKSQTSPDKLLSIIQDLLPPINIIN